jgi:hypothetical protein
MEGSWTSQLVGKTVTSIERSNSCACVVSLSGGYRVQVESLWRLVTSAALLLTSRDDGQRFGRKEPVRALAELSDELVGDTIVAVQLGQGTADLSLHFKQKTFQVVSDSSGYEAWQVVGPAGTVAVGQGGGDVAVWG